MAMGYADQMDAFGFGELARTAASHWSSGDRTEAMASLPEAMVDELAIYGTYSACRRQARAWYETGVEELILIPPFSIPREAIENLIAVAGRLPSRA
jgi:alkanesulfonate monooxygenase SsuD/methylene tetrahydromethanopterin reductase-like flavin-dependent oxidoreductase (luciferase family)